MCDSFVGLYQYWLNWIYLSSRKTVVNFSGIICFIYLFLFSVVTLLEFWWWYCHLTLSAVSWEAVVFHCECVCQVCWMVLWFSSVVWWIPTCTRSSPSFRLRTSFDFLSPCFLFGASEQHFLEEQIIFFTINVYFIYNPWTTSHASQ